MMKFAAMNWLNRKRLKNTAFVLFGIYLGGGILIYLLQDLMIFHPKSLPRHYQFRFDQPFEEMNFPRGDRNLNLIKFKPAVRKGLVLYFHGNMENVERYGNLSSLFTQSGYEVWMMDYPGFGKTTGKRTEETMYSDAHFVYEQALKEVPATEIIIYGRSLGTGIASELASRQSCKKLILETPYYSIRALARSYFPIYPAILNKYSFTVAEHLQKVKAPVFLIHGTADEVVPYRQSVRLRKETPGVHLITIEKGRHNNLADFELFKATLQRLLFN